MSDNEFFPEDGYDPTSGEYSREFDFEPEFKYRVVLDSEGLVVADVFAVPGFEPQAEAAANLLEDLAGSGIFDPDFNARNPDHYPNVPPDFDYGGDNIRGPYPDRKTVERFLDESGLRGTALVYYDEIEDEFWIDVDTN